MNDTTLAAAERIRAFADAVRAQLADLPPDDVEDLVDGLIGDLTDQAADNDGEIELGDPAAYAYELRSAAGLPERGPLVVTKTPWHERIAAIAGRWVGRIRSSMFGAWLLDLLTSLRPVWWVLRGVTLAALFAMPAGLGPLTASGFAGFPSQVFFWALVATVILISVQWGRGRWLPRNRLRHVRTVASIIALLFLPTLSGYAATILSAPANHGTYYAPPPQGLLLDGVQVGNLFVYDKDGNPIEGAQIYTNRGTPLNLFGGESQYADGVRPAENGTTTVPFRDAQGQPVWNVYPLQLGRYEDVISGDLTATSDPQPPFLRAPARILTSPGATGAPTAPPSPSPIPGTSQPTPVPSAAPTP
jgi:hypothetical protein